LIVPICLSGSFEDYSSINFQCLDYTNYCKDPRVQKLPIKLENEIENLAKTIYNKLNHIPEWREDFIVKPHELQVDTSLSTVKVFYKRTKFICPKL
jgi:hypothetical protein